MTKKSHIEAQNVSLDYEILDSNKRIFTNSILNSLRISKSKNVKGSSSLRALDSLNFKFGPGSRIGIWGPNGAGKSSLLRLLAGIYTPSEGVFSSSGKIASLIDIGLGVMPDATGRENIYTRALLWGMSKKEIQAKFNEIVELSELGTFIDLPVRTYSSGMQMRLAFAVAISVDANILLMDEWLSVGDEAFQEKAEKLLIEKVAASEIFFLASHSKELLAKVTDTVLVLNHGKIEEIISSKNLLERGHP